MGMIYNTISRAVCRAVRDPAFSIWNCELLGELYWHLPWVAPVAFEFANEHLGQDEVARFVIEARAQLQRLTPEGFEAKSYLASFAAMS